MVRLRSVYPVLPQLPVLLMTAYGAVERAVEAMRQGAADYLVKPFEPRTLLELVARHALGRVSARVGEGPVACEPASQQLLELACDIARQVVRQELRTNPQALMPVLREALDMLGAETKPATVRIHPDDWQQLEPHVRAALPNPRVQWLADASVQPGDCMVESQGAQVDGSLEKRWQRAVAALGLVSTWYEGAPHA